MSTETLTSTDTTADQHFQDRMARATDDERDAVFAELTARVDAGDELAVRTIRLLVLPACRRMARGRSDEFLAACVDAAFAEVMGWAATAGRRGQAVR